MISLRDMGALVGQDASSALLRAFDKASASYDQTIVVDGFYLITNPVVYNFASKLSTLKIIGLGSKSKLVPHVKDDAVAISLSNLESFTMHDVVFAGYPNDNNDAGSVLSLSYMQHANLERTHFFGIACTRNQVMLGFSQSDVAMRDCLIYGCAGGSGAKAGLVHNENWRGFLMERCQFKDYGLLNGAYTTKTPLSASFSWVNIGDVSDAPTNAWSPTMARIMDSRFDEGALFGIACQSNPAKPRIRGVRVGNCGFNVFNNQAGIFANGVNDVVVEDSFFGWATQPSSPVYLLNTDRARLTRCRVGQGVRGLNLGDGVGSVVLEDSPTITSSDTRVVTINNGRV